MANNNKDNTEITVSITEYTRHIVIEAVNEAMKQHQESCPLSKVVKDLSEDMWGNASINGVKNKVRILQDDLLARKKNVNLFKRPLFNGLVGAGFVWLGFLLKGVWAWFQNKI